MTASPSPASPADDVAGLIERDRLGRKVREAWVRWALTQPAPKPSWLVPYDELNEPDKEADRQIGEAVTAEAAAALCRLQAELDVFTKAGIIEVSVRNQSVSDYMRHWEGRTLAAEARLASTETDLYRTRVMWDETAARQVKLEISLAKVTAARDEARKERAEFAIDAADQAYRKLEAQDGEANVRTALAAAEASAATMREALTKAGVIAFEMRARDKQNGILTDWWQTKLDALIAALSRGDNGQG